MMTDVVGLATRTSLPPRQLAACEVELGHHRRSFEEWTPGRGRIFERFFAIDVETTRIDDENSHLIPAMVVAAACDDRRGAFISREALPAFFAAHSGSAMIMHNAPFDLKAMQPILGLAADLYEWVEQGRVWDTQVLRRLLALATEGHTARGRSSLARSVNDLLGLRLSKEDEEEDGGRVRTGFGRYLGRPLSELPAASLAYAARDSLATWVLFWELNSRVKRVLKGSSDVWGYVDAAWLRAAIQRFGPLTHHIQLRAAILVDALRMNGIAIDRGRRSENLELVGAVKAEY